MKSSSNFQYLQSMNKLGISDVHINISQVIDPAFCCVVVNNITGTITSPAIMCDTDSESKRVGEVSCSVKLKIDE
jgi:hypothetical protein